MYNNIRAIILLLNIVTSLSHNKEAGHETIIIINNIAILCYSMQKEGEVRLVETEKKQQLRIQPWDLNPELSINLTFVGRSSCPQALPSFCSGHVGEWALTGPLSGAVAASTASGDPGS